ncbi:hypothetical protein CYFUS_001612 [Cystobacter fuscus]|uniref:Uncharacterized protein n=2 Tax=Cystobacter fuscus TaxID=43 RepID=A0A250IY84_9BACT|nr:hypothetical protein CYFUS_001612 [Cystobacter fuscus]
MRYLFIAVVMCGLEVGCVTPKVTAPPPVSEDMDQWKRRYEEERERVEALAMRLASVESALEVVNLERAEQVLLPPLWQDELERVQAERHTLVEHNAQLVTKQRELTAIQEELEDVWYQSALSRARRRSQPQPLPIPPLPPATPPAESASTP